MHNTKREKCVKTMDDIYVRPSRSMPLSKRVFKAEIVNLKRAKKNALIEAEKRINQEHGHRKHAEKIDQQLQKAYRQIS